MITWSRVVKVKRIKCGTQIMTDRWSWAGLR